MRKFFTFFLLGIVAFIAYTYGAKAGRGRYHEIQAALDALWNDPRVKKARKRAVKRAERAAKQAGNRAAKAL